MVPANDRRRRLTHRFYGDSGIFVRRPDYFRLGGFKPWPVMHDYAFSARMHRAGRTAYIRDPAVLASARRFEGRELRTLARWIATQGLYWLFVPPRVLGRLYPDVRGERPWQFIDQWRSVASKTKVSSATANFAAAVLGKIGAGMQATASRPAAAKPTHILETTKRSFR